MTAQIPAPAVDAGQRGATRIADRVVAKIAAQAAREALRTPPDGTGDAHATVTVRRHSGQQSFGEARVRISVELGYPSDIGAQCGAVRRRVVERVWALAGMTVPEVAVQVEHLHAPQAERSGQGRVR